MVQKNYAVAVIHPPFGLSPGVEEKTKTRHGSHPGGIRGPPSRFAPQGHPAPCDNALRTYGYPDAHFEEAAL
jgi:hypothetical protein